MKKDTSRKIIAITITLMFISTGFITLSAQKNEYKTIQNKKTLSDETNDNFFDTKISLLMKIAKFPSLSTCIIKDDQVVFSKGYGYYDIEKQKKATNSTIYVIASITKTIVGTALMQLWEQKLFKLDEDVNQYLPFELKNPYFPEVNITFRMLLSHTSSLNTNTKNAYYWMNFSGDPPFSFFPQPFLEEFLTPDGKYYHEDVWSKKHRPGEHAMYANIGFDIISYLVEIISDQPFLEYCQKNIFQPLKMYNTSFNLSTLNIENVARPYQYFFGRYQPVNKLGYIYGNNFTSPTPYWRMRSYPAGGLYTTIDDLSHFLIAHMNQGIYQNTRILEKNTVELMHEIRPDNEIGYGLAWMKKTITPRVSATGHGGDIMGADTWMLHLPEENIGVIYFANGNPVYGFMPQFRSIAVQLLLFTLFKKAGLNYVFSPNINVQNDDIMFLQPHFNFAK
ncbi:MAG: serine hydrolase domain-containing protein [Candidatus Thermoplasmatota archaeon]